MSERGLLLVLEGVEGVGKTTQWRRLTELLQSTGTPLVAVREPGGTIPGDAMRRLLLDPVVTLSDAGEALLFAASRAELIAQIIQPALERGEVVLLDRFLLSTYAYQGAGRGLNIATLRMINEFATRHVVPDATFLLTMPLDTALGRASARSAADRIEREERAFHANVANAFAEASTQAWQNEHPECGPIISIDATGTPEQVTQLCAQHLARKWPSRFGALTELSHATTTAEMHA